MGRAANQASPAAVSLPEGGGAISGLGETFRAGAENGVGTLTVPIEATYRQVGLA